MSISIVNAELKHIQELAALEAQCFSVPWTADQLISQMPDDKHVFIAAVDDCGRVLGYVGMLHIIDEGYISNVAVSPEHRRQGIADMLIDSLCAEAEQLELSFVTLEVREGNSPARALYAKHGFTDVGCRKKYYSNPTENAILMTLFLK